MTMLLAAAQPPPAGGAALAEVIGASVAVGLVTTVLLYVGWAHRTRRITWLGRTASRIGEPLGLPGWVALPTVLCAGSLLTALFGMLWDISLHIGQGRDPGPLANPAHYFILVGLFGIFAAGTLAVALPLDEEPGPASVRITRDWHAPIGGLLVAGSGFYALLGFPLDDVWHRIFGQDVTLWGPTHLMLITGAGLSLVGLVVLEREGRIATRGVRATVTGPRALISRARHVFAFGGLLIGLSVFQGEFDFGVPQFRMVLHPVMLAAAAGFALVAARAWLGKGAALGAVAFFLVVRGTIAVLVGPILGEPTPHFPLYLGSAMLIELLALTPLLSNKLAFGAVAGFLVGSVGTLIEAGWTQLAMPLPWGSDVLVEGTLSATLVGIAAGACGALLAMGLVGELPRPRVARGVIIGGTLVLAGVAANGLIATVPSGVTATITLASPDAARTQATVRITPASAVDDPSWLTITAWQGGGLVLDDLRRTGPGTYETTEPVPITGDWKTTVRLHDGRALYAAALYLPADSAIGVDAIPATAVETRPFIPEIQLLQRERDLSVPGWIWGAASMVVLACSLALVLALSWGVARLSRAIEGPTSRTQAAAPPPRVPQPA